LFFGTEGAKLHEDLVTGHPQITMELNAKLLELAEVAKKTEKVKAIIDKFLPRDIPEKLTEFSEGKNFLLDFEAFLATYGDREVSQGLGGIAAFTWREKPEVVWGMLKGSMLAENTPQVSEALVVRRKNAEARLEELIAAGGIKLAPFIGILNKLIDYGRKYTAFREDSHFYLTQAMPVFRSMFMEIGRQLVTRRILNDANDVMYFTYWELKEIIYALYSYKKISKLEIEEHLLGEKQKLERRKKKWLARGLQVELSGNILQGVGASSGKASGVCRVILSPEEFSRLKPGDILVAKYTNPSWTPVFSFIGGLVVEYGSAVSHAAIIAREYGIPAILGVKGVTHLLKDGEVVTIDGGKGLIQRRE
jgi:pyruvate,water dikinase